MDEQNWQKHLGPEYYAGGEESAELPYEQRVAFSAAVLRFVPEDKRNVLVVGCGDGAEVKWLKDRRFNVVGITRNQKEVAAATRRYGLAIDYGDMHELPYANERFDCVVAKDVFEHALAPAIVMSEFHRVLRLGGWLIVTMPSPEWSREFYHHHVLTHGQMHAMLRKHSFELLAGPGIRRRISPRYPLTLPLGWGVGHIDIFICRALRYREPADVIDVAAVHGRPLRRVLKKIYAGSPQGLARVLRSCYDGLLRFIARWY